MDFLLLFRNVVNWGIFVFLCFYIYYNIRPLRVPLRTPSRLPLRTPLRIISRSAVQPWRTPAPEGVRQGVRKGGRRGVREGVRKGVREDGRKGVAYRVCERGEPFILYLYEKLKKNVYEKLKKNVYEKLKMESKIITYTKLQELYKKCKIRIMEII